MSCEGCPLATVLDTAEEVVSITENTEKDRAIGGIAITREVFNRVLGRLDCTGPRLNQSEQLDCPLRETVYGTRGLAISPWPKQNFVVDLEKGIVENQETDNSSPGQYI